MSEGQQGPRTSRPAGLSGAELLSLLQELLAGEIAGARVCLQSARSASDPYGPLLSQIHRDEAHWCDLLTRHIKRLGGEPASQAGPFLAKAMAIADLRERMAFLNRGQAWVVRKLRESLPAIQDESLRSDLSEMLEAHQDNIDKVAALN
ncbi:MAG: hypothetical protein JOY91_14390 [Sinobacteraceae bacterium]|nr:hypothetical protein [Nevskiaceae bacterium]